ncbi:endonuclease/exonuclease/phosphatase family protein [Aquabacterium sp.]|uniref:endonuclease/exonuclease/phosphatase family protein n=1 Tax=Aquabacterium sp. TaxID=1872578 RepID=UPI002C85FAE5|nr:endonuclease/exonuclease/phosphatase family protein [Aquabacterium sp.]HSW09271.1 endonuclease/exonuclease/phosphatase family protein [Aquabacterium sp.]
MTLTILTVNLHKGFGAFNRRFVLHELRDAVRSVSADVVFLQEVMGEHELHAAKVPGWPTAPHYEFLADTLWTDFAYGRNAVYPAGHHGNALLSKFVIVRHQNHDVSVAGLHDVAERRGLLHGVLQLPGGGRELHAICVHLGLRESHRSLQVQGLCRLINGLPDDALVVVAGDFNDWQQHAHEPLRRCAGLQEVFVQAHGSAAKTFPARWPLLRLDRIYVRGASVQRPVVLPRRPWSHLSDHAPLVAEIRL